MKKIKHLLIFIVSLLSIILVCYKNNYKVNAATNTYTAVWDLLNLSMNINDNSIDNDLKNALGDINWGTQYRLYNKADGTDLKYPYNFKYNGICLAADQNAKDVGYQYSSPYEEGNGLNRTVELSCILIIDEEGNIKIKKSKNGNWENVSNISKEEGKKLAAMCTWASSEVKNNDKSSWFEY